MMIDIFIFIAVKYPCSLKERDRLEELRLHPVVTMKYIVKMGWRALTGHIWLKVRTNDRILWTR